MMIQVQSQDLKINQQPSSQFPSLQKISFENIDLDKQYPRLYEEFTSNNQGHVFKYWDQLDNSQKKSLLYELNSFSVKKINTLYNNVKEVNVDMKENIFQPLTDNTIDPKSLSGKEIQDFTYLGAEKIYEGKVMVVLMAGGSGTRLKFQHPKGMYKPGLLSQRSIFELLVNRYRGAHHFSQMILKSDLDQYKRKECHFLVMTSEQNHNQTLQFFQTNKYFGVKNISFFPQGMLPALDFDGKIIMQGKGKVSRSGNGNGGLLQSFNTLTKLRNLVQQMINYQLDNILNKIMDPFTIGTMIVKQAESVGKIVPKSSPQEKVGVFCKKNGKYVMVEYTEIGEEMSKLEHEGKLVYNQGSICIFFLSSKFLIGLVQSDEMMSQLNKLYNLQKKKIAKYDEELGKAVKPQSQNNGYKYELFINSFSLFVQQNKFWMIEVDRQNEFAPVKNAEGQHSPAQARQLFSNMCKKWIIKAGGKIHQNEQEDDIYEVDFLQSYDGENLEKFVEDQAQFEGITYIGRE